ncbi:MAG TPA: hypothetical protein VKA21_14430, partial [Candidatus Binatia bacterium]|nr:hypothetical protein [Candidatus Binatia bacterium]
CDDGNAVDADCCSSACVAAADPDGDGVCGVADGCPAVPDPGQEDADGDGIGDACDPCTNGSELAGVVTVGGLGLPAGDERLWLDADLPLPARDRQFAPAEHGLRILIADAAGAPVVEATVPPGRSPSGGLGGWSRAAGGWRYRAAKDATGIRRVAGRIVGGRLRVHVRAGHGTYAVDPARTPLRVTLVLDPPSARTGACAEAIVAACVAHRDVVRCATSAPALRSARARRL